MSHKDVLEFVREDDFVEYFLFPSLHSQNESEQEQALSSLLNKVNGLVTSLSQGYLWHKDAFKLVPRTSITNKLNHLTSQKGALPPHLYGISHYGDNIEDEWFIVYLLKSITAQIPDVICRVCDSDGEFLLIEAADYLPSWAQPEICDNRVYLLSGNVHIIPSEDDEPLSVPEALLTLRNNPSTTQASAAIQNAIINKISAYPKRIEENLHHATIHVPIGVATILKHKPNLIAPAILAFCNRDSIDVKVCSAMKYFPPESCVYTRATFTRYLYAMLKHSKYVPDRRTGWKIPPMTSKNFNAHNLGVRVACGFEILISQAKPSADIESDKAWMKYLDSLKENNYFNGLIEHSKGYNVLLGKAKDFYRDYRDTMQYTPAIGQEVLDLTKSLENQVGEFEGNLAPDDPDGWLNIGPQELDEMLKEKYGRKEFIEVNEERNADSLTDNMSKFLNHMSGVDGAEFPDETAPTKPPRTNKKSKVSFSQESKTESNRVNFDANAFDCAMNNILSLSIPEDDSWNLESGSDMSDYEEDNYVKMGTYDEVKSKMQEYMEEMDKELAATTIGESFEKKASDDFDDIESFRPVDIDVNALKNIMESYRTQMGEAGPSTNMLGPMGVHLDTNKNRKAK